MPGVDPISAGVDLGAQFIGGYSNYRGQKVANQRNENDQNRVRRWIEELLTQQGAAGQAALGARKQGQRQAAAGYDRGLAEVANFGTSATRDVLDREQQQIGSGVSDLIAMGRYNPQMSLLSRRGISYDTGKLLTDIASRTSQARAGLQVGKGNALAAGSSDIAAQIMANFAGRADIRQNEAQFALSQPATFTDYSAQIGGMFGAGEQAFRAFSGGGNGRPDTGYSLPNDTYGPT